MKRLKRCLLLIITAAMVLSQMTVFADVLYPELTKNQETTIEYNEKTYGYSAALLLEALGVENVLDGMDEKINRSEFCDIMANVIKNVGVDDTGAEKRFSDVTEATEYLKEISMLSSMGYVVGYSNMEFKPNEIITLKEVICVFIRALGYENWAETMGGYYSGYDTISRKLDLTKNFNGDANELKKSDVYVLIENFLNADLLERKSNSRGGYTYEPKEGVSYLNNSLDIYKYEGRVTDNGVTAINSTEAYGINCAIIGDEIYNIGKLDLSQCIGTYVKGYYIDDNGEKTLLTAIEVERYSKSVLLDIDDIESMTASKIDYDKDGKNRSIKIADNANYIYNGLYSESLTKEMIDNIDIGSVKAISYNNNNTYDVLIINSYDVVVTETASINTEKICGKYGEIYDLSLYENYKILKEGKEITLSELHDFDVLLILKNKKNFTAYYTNQAVYGSVQTITNSDKSPKYTIEGKEYKLLKNYKKSRNVNITVGVSGTFYIVNDKYIVYFEADSNEQIGFLHWIGSEITEKGEESVLVTIFTASGTWLRAYAQERVKLNGKSFKRERLVDSKSNLGLVDSEGKTIRNPITYKTNKDGDISLINIPDKTMPDSDTIQPATDKTSERLQWRDADIFLDPSAMMIWRYVTKNSMYFQVPLNPEDTQYYSTQTGFPGKHDAAFTISAYYTKRDSKKYFSPDIVIEYKDGATPKADGFRLSIVKSIGEGLNKDDLAVPVLNVLHNGEEVSYCAADPNKIINGLKPGDVVKIWCNGDNEMVAYRKAYNPDNRITAQDVLYNSEGKKKTEEESKETIEQLWGIGNLSQYDERYFIGDFPAADGLKKPTDPNFYDYLYNSYVYRELYTGIVENVGNGLLTFKTDNGKTVLFSTTGGDRIYKTHVVIATESNGKYTVESGKIEDILNTDRALIRGYDGNTPDIVIYR